MLGLTLFALAAATTGLIAQNANIQPKAAAKSAPAVSTKLPVMRLEAQFRGPQQDTIIQRWRDPATNAVCYIYLPIVVQHSARTPTGYVQYGANSIGSISCVSGK